MIFAAGSASRSARRHSRGLGAVASILVGISVASSNSAEVSSSPAGCRAVSDLQPAAEARRDNVTEKPCGYLGAPRLSALMSAFIDAVAMLGSRPTPQTTVLSGISSST